MSLFDELLILERDFFAPKRMARDQDAQIISVM